MPTKLMSFITVPNTTEESREIFAMEFSVDSGARNLNAGDRGNPIVNLEDGALFNEVYRGDKAALLSMAAGLNSPTAITREDFDNDAMRDVETAYATVDGGFISLRRGNPDVISSMSTVAIDRAQNGLTSDNPFFDDISL